MSKTSKIASALLLICGLTTLGWYFTTNIDQPAKKPASTRILTFEEFCIENKLECSVQSTGSMQTYTAVNPWFQAKGENSELKLGWGVSQSSSSGNNGNYASTSTVTGFGPALSFHWDVAQFVRNLNLKEREH
ncbi:MAG: hypothetical protein WAV46_02925 [Candidatus Moraniibacteriota bacterium]